jgi:hypothetical protein
MSERIVIALLVVVVFSLVRAAWRLLTGATSWDRDRWLASYYEANGRGLFDELEYHRFQVTRDGVRVFFDANGRVVGYWPGPKGRSDLSALPPKRVASETRRQPEA